MKKKQFTEQQILGFLKEAEAGTTACSVAWCAGLATIAARNVALGASTPWKRIRCSLGRGTSAARRCMSSSGDITIWVVPSR